MSLVPSELPRDETISERQEEDRNSSGGEEGSGQEQGEDNSIDGETSRDENQTEGDLEVVKAVHSIRFVSSQDTKQDSQIPIRQTGVPHLSLGQLLRLDMTPRSARQRYETKAADFDDEFEFQPPSDGSSFQFQIPSSKQPKTTRFKSGNHLVTRKAYEAHLSGHSATEREIFSSCDENQHDIMHVQEGTGRSFIKEIMSFVQEEGDLGPVNKHGLDSKTSAYPSDNRPAILDIEKPSAPHKKCYDSFHQKTSPQMGLFEHPVSFTTNAVGGRGSRGQVWQGKTSVCVLTPPSDGHRMPPDASLALAVPHRYVIELSEDNEAVGNSPQVRVFASTVSDSQMMQPTSTECEVRELRSDRTSQTCLLFASELHRASRTLIFEEGKDQNHQQRQQLMKHSRHKSTLLVPFKIASELEEPGQQIQLYPVQSSEELGSYADELGSQEQAEEEDESVDELVSATDLVLKRVHDFIKVRSPPIAQTGHQADSPDKISINQTCNSETSAPILTIAKRNGRVVIESVPQWGGSAANMTHLENTFNSDPQLNNLSHSRLQGVASECSREEKKALKRLFNSVEHAFTTLQKVKNRDQSLLIKDQSTLTQVEQSLSRNAASSEQD